MKLLRCFLPGLLAAGAFASAWGQAADPLDTLVKDSPFMPAAAGPGGPAETGPLEFRGVVMEGGGYTFSVYDQGTRESSWVRVGDKGLPFSVRSYNRDTDTLVVEQNGRTLNLSLQTAKVANAPAVIAPAPMPLPAPGQGPGPAVTAPGTGPGPQPMAGRPGGEGNGPVPTNVSSEEAQRLQKMADEIRRRRNMRAGNPNNSTP